MSDTPTNLLEVIELIGEAAALKLVNTFGGQTVRIPALTNATAEHPLAQCMGQEALIKLSTAKGASWLYVPKCARGLLRQRNILIVKDYNEGIKVNVMVQRYGLSDRQIWNILGSTAIDDRQSGLF